MEWLDLVGPSAAVIAFFGAVALIVVVVRQGRAIRRLEDRLADEGDAAVDAPLRRIAELQARHEVSEGSPGLHRQLRAVAAFGIALIVVVLAIGAVWYIAIRDDDGGSATTAQGEPQAKHDVANPTEPVRDTRVPSNAAPLTDPSQYTVAVFNAGGVDGAAGRAAGRLEVEGYQVLPANDLPGGPTGDAESVVMWTRGNKQVAESVAGVLGIRRAPPLDGLSPEQIGNADVAVVVGLDISGSDDGDSASAGSQTSTAPATTP